MMQILSKEFYPHSTFSPIILKKDPNILPGSQKNYNDRLRSIGSRKNMLTTLEITMAYSTGILRNSTFDKLHWHNCPLQVFYRLSSADKLWQKHSGRGCGDGSDSYGEVIYDKGKYYVKKGQSGNSNPINDKDLVLTSFSNNKHGCFIRQIVLKS